MDLTVADKAKAAKSIWDSEWAGRAPMIMEMSAPAIRHMTKEMVHSEDIVGKTILDVGSGNSPNAQVFYSMGAADVVNADFSRFALIEAQRRTNVLVQADAASLPFRDLAVDTVVSTLAVEHLGRNAEQAIREFARVSRNVVAFSVPDFEAVRSDGFLTKRFGYGFLFFHRYEQACFTEQGISELVRKAGLEPGFKNGYAMHSKDLKPLILVSALKPAKR